MRKISTSLLCGSNKQEKLVNREKSYSFRMKIKCFKENIEFSLLQFLDLKPSRAKVDSTLKCVIVH